MSPGDENDGALVDRAKSGAVEAFSELVSRHYRAVAGFARRFFRRTEDREDFVQEVFLRAYKSLPGYSGRGRFISWLLAIAYHLGIRSGRAAVQQEALLPVTELPADTSPEDEALAAVAAEAVRDAMKELTPPQAACLELYFFHSLSYEEVAAGTGYTLNTVRSHIRRGKQRLMDVLGEDPRFGGGEA